MAHSSIKCYLSAVRHLQISRGYSDPFLVDFLQLQMLLRGVKVCRGLQRPPSTHLQVAYLTKYSSSVERSVVSPSSHEYHYIMLGAVCCYCFFGFFHLGKLLVPSLSAFDPSSHITINDIAVDDDRNPAMIQFTLKASKTDPFRKGVQVAVGKTEDDICPVRALMEFLAVRGSKPGPLFCSQNSSPFICSQFVGKIKKALQ